MAKFRKKPVVIEAVQVADENISDLLALMNASPDVTLLCQLEGEAITNFVHSVEVKTLEGVMVGHPGDWIITGVAGEHYPCKDDIFRATYEPAD